MFILEQTSRKIYTVVPEDGTILADIPIPEKTCESIAYDGRYLWVADRTKDEIYMVDPKTGTVIGVLAAPGPYAAGLAWVDGYLWNVDFQNRQLYKLMIDAEKPYRLTDTRMARVEYYWALNNYGPGAVTDIAVNVAFPRPSQTRNSSLKSRFPPPRRRR